jgi:hypothetical protein
MSKTLIGILFIIVGLAYGSMAIDVVYNFTLGYLIENSWLKPPAPDKLEKNLLGRKPTILFYSLGLIIIGIYILWNRKI